MPRRKHAWEKLSDEQLLKQRFSSLKVAVEGTWLEDCLGTLNEELQAKGIRLRPHAWISSEWFSPADVPGIAIPFYLAHPRLMKLEKKMMLDVEGGTWSESMAILRPEAGHGRELNLRAVGSDRKLVADFTVLLTAKTMHALFGPSRRKWIAL
jgi:hypothetical protein